MSEKEKKMTRREAIKALAVTSVGSGLIFAGCKTDQSHQSQGVHAGHLPGEEALLDWEKQFFTDHEFETVTRLANLIIPSDEHSGNAEDANVPNFIDFMMLEHSWNQTKMRGGLRWLDIQCNRMFGQDFIRCNKQDQIQILDEIAYPEIAKKEFHHGVHFFNMFRDYTASGFWSSKMGMNDIGYVGNVATFWDGPPPEVLDKLGLT